MAEGFLFSWRNAFQIKAYGIPQDRKYIQEGDLEYAAGFAGCCTLVRWIVVGLQAHEAITMGTTDDLDLH